MRKNIIINLINIIIWASLLVVIIFIKLNPLSIIFAFIIALINVLLAIYSMGHREHPEIKIGKIKGSMALCNLAIFIIQLLLILASLSSSLWVVLILISGTFVFIELIMVFLKELYEFLRFYITITFTISFPALILYNILLVYKKYGGIFSAGAISNLTLIIAVLFIVLYVFLIFKERNIIKITSYSVLFNMSLILLSAGGFTSQEIYSSIVYIISFIPAMFILITASYSISDSYKNNGTSGIKAVFMHLPFSGAGYFIGLLAIMGFPPFSLFFGRLRILQSSGISGDYVRIILMGFTVIISTYYLLSRVIPILFGSRQSELMGMKENKYSVFILIFLIILALLLIVSIPGFIDGLINNARAYVIGDL